MKDDKPYSVLGRMLFEQRVPREGVDVARCPGHLWLRGETDEAESTDDFIARARREAREAGFANIEVSGHLNVDEEPSR